MMDEENAALLTGSATTLTVATIVLKILDVRGIIEWYWVLFPAAFYFIGFVAIVMFILLLALNYTLGLGLLTLVQAGRSFIGKQKKKFPWHLLEHEAFELNWGPLHAEILFPSRPSGPVQTALEQGGWKQHGELNWVK